MKTEFETLKWLIIAIITLLIVDVTVITNITFLRPAVVILYLSIIPGYLILQILKLDKISFIKKSLLSVGASLSFTMIFGLFLNSLFPIILKPLSLTSLLISFNMSILALITLAFKGNREGFIPKRILNIKTDFKNRYKSVLLFPTLFPLMAILGTYLMNTYENNGMILLMLFLIPFYIVLLTYLNDNRLSSLTYPFAVWMISLSLLLMHGLTSNHLMGIDIHIEFYSFQVTLNNFHWSASQYYSASNSVLSVTILPTIYYVLSDLNAEYIFKLVYAFIASLMPLGIYIISRKYLNPKYALIASLFLLFQVAFIYNLLSSTKTLISIFFFITVILLVFEDEIPHSSKKILLVIFLASIVVSHYTTSFILLFILTSVYVMSLIMRYIVNHKPEIQLNKPVNYFFSWKMILLLFSLILIWDFLLTSAPATNTLKFFHLTLYNLQNIFVPESRATTQLAVLGIESTKIPQKINTIIYDMFFLTIGLGIFYIIRKHNYEKLNIEIEYIFAAIASLVLLFLFLFLPYLSRGYGGTRLFTQLSVFLVIPFIFGGIAMAKIIKKPKLDLILLLIIIISVFSSVTYLPYHFLGNPVSPDYEKLSLIRGQTYIYHQDIVTAEWLRDYGYNYLVYSDRSGSFALALVLDEDPYKVSKNTFFSKNQTKKETPNKVNEKESSSKNKTKNAGYIYLRKINVQGFVYGSGDSVKNITDYIDIFMNKNKIYDNGGGNIWFFYLS